MHVYKSKCSNPPILLTFLASSVISDSVLCLIDYGHPPIGRTVNIYVIEYFYDTDINIVL